MQVLQELLELLELHLLRRSVQDEHQLEQLYQREHRLQGLFPQLEKESLYQPCR